MKNQTKWLLTGIGLALLSYILAATSKLTDNMAIQMWHCIASLITGITSLFVVVYAIDEVKD